MSYQSVERSQGTIQNIQMVQNSLNPDAKTVLDIGCNESILTAHLENLGLTAAGIEGNIKAVNDSRTFLTSNKNKLQVEHRHLELDEIKNLPDYDVIIFNSVHHQLVKNNGLEYANRFLIELAKKAKLQFYFQPCTIHLKHGMKMPFVENDMNGIKDYFQDLITQSIPGINCRLLGFSDNNIPPQEPLRPLMLFSKTENNSGIRIPHAQKKDASPAKLRYIDIDHCISSRDMQSYDVKNGWHHKVSTCLDIIRTQSSKDQSLAIKNTDVYRYFKSLAPTKFGQVWRKQDIGSDIGVLENMPARNYCFWVPWGNPPDSDENILNGVTEAAEIPDWDMTFYGPKSDQEMVQIVKRLHDLIVKINSEGHIPQVKHDGYIRGSIMRKNDDYRFILSAGQHRTAVLAALGYEQVLAKITGPDILFEDAANWPLVKRGVYTVTQAQDIFNGFFDCNGQGMRPTETYQ